MFGADVDADAHAAADVDVDVDGDADADVDVDHCISELECGLAGLSLEQTITINEGPASSLLGFR